MEQGYIKLYRVFKEWEWYDDINTKVLFLHLLLNANYQDKKWHGVDIKRGQILTGVHELAKQTTLSEQNVRTSLNKLKLTGELTSQSTNRYSIITLNSYDKYQSTNKLDNEQLTNNQQTTNKQLTTTNKEKNLNIKESKEKRYIPTFESFWKLYPSENRTKKDECMKIYNLYCTTEEKENDFMKALDNYKSSKKFKEGFIQNSLTWFRDWRTWLDYEQEIIKNKYEGSLI